MKRIFVIHSALTEIITQAIIDLEMIKFSDVLIILDRNYIPFLLDYETLDVTYNSKYILTRQPIQKYIFNKKWVNYFNEKIQFKQYELYLPHSYLNFYSNMILNNLCLKYNYIEEGLAAYIPEFFLNNNQRRSFKNYTKALLLMSAQKEKFNRGKFFVNGAKLNHCYAITELAFLPYQEKVKLIDLQKLKSVVDYSAQESLDALLIFDGLVPRSLISLEESLMLLEEKILPSIKNKNYKIIGYKLHPDQVATSQEVRRIISTLTDFTERNSIKLFEISNISVELYLLTNQVDIYTYVSSLGFYAGYFGSKSYTIRNELYKMSPLIKKNAKVDNYMEYL